jgi:hypothetical protein
MRFGSRSRVALLALAFLAAPGAAVAGDPPKVTPRLTDRPGSSLPSPEPVLRIESRLSLEKISTAELTGHGRGRALALGTPSFGGWGLDLSPWVIEVSRELPSIWSLRLGRGGEASALDVSYELVGSNGHEGTLSHVDRPGSEIQVLVEPGLPELRDEGPEGPVLEGGALLRLRIEGAHVAGRYSGTLIVTVNHF